ncbi:MAG: hypothetical protein AB7N80_04980 [Bdellovibrionales bacterium]
MSQANAMLLQKEAATFRFLRNPRVLALSGRFFLYSQVTLMIILDKFGDPWNIIKLQTTLDPGEFQLLLHSQGVEGLAAWIRHYLIDFFYPIFYGVFLAAMLVRWPPSRNDKLLKLVLIVPLLAGLFDEIENVCQLLLALERVPIDSIYFYVGAASARLKWSMLLTTLVLIILGGMAHRANAGRPEGA